MGWNLRTRPDDTLLAGDTVQFILHFSYVPVVPVNPQSIQDALNSGAPLFVASVERSWLASLTFSDEWEVTASVTSDVTVGELSALIASIMNRWYSWGVSISDVKTETWTPDLTPSTQTAVSLAALAVIVVIGFLVAKKGGLA